MVVRARAAVCTHLGCVVPFNTVSPWLITAPPPPRLSASGRLRLPGNSRTQQMPDSDAFFLGGTVLTMWRGATSRKWHNLGCFEGDVSG